MSIGGGGRTPQKPEAIAAQAEDEQAILKREAEVLALRCAGATFGQIADKLRMHNAAHACKVYKRALLRIPSENAREARLRYDETCNAQLRALAKVINKQGAKDADIISACREMNTIDSRRMTILGYAKPQRHAVGGDPQGAPINARIVPPGELAEMSDEQLEEIARATAEAAALAAAAAARRSGAGAPPQDEDD